MLSTFNFQHDVGNVQELRLHKRGGSTLYLFSNFLLNCPIITTVLTLILIREDKNIFCSKLGRSLQSAPLVNSYALLTYKRVGSGSFTSGIAYVGQVCGSKSKRVNINLYWGDSIRTSEVRRKGSITFFLNPSLNYHHILCLVDCCSRDRPQLEHEA